MKKVLFALGIALILGIGFLSTKAHRSTANEKAVGQIRFEEPITINDLQNYSSHYHLDLAVVGSKFGQDDLLVQDFMTINPGIADISQEFKISRKAYLKDFINEQIELDASLSSELQSELEVAQGLLSKPDNLNLQVYQATFRGSRDNLQALQKLSDFKQLQIKSLVEINDLDKDIQVTADENDKWYPTSGKSIIKDSSVEGERYAQQYMKWKKSLFDSNDTYEHDFFLNNYDEKTYLDGDSTAYPGCFPATTYFSSTWPSSAKVYLDTRFSYLGCESDELAYTLGAAKANKLKKGKTYHNYVRTKKGNTSSDKFKIQAQLGHRLPSSCYTTWCSFGDKILNLVPAWKNKAPGIYSWTK